METESRDEVVCPACGYRWCGEPGDWFMGHDNDMRVWEQCPKCTAPLVIEGYAEVTHVYQTTLREEAGRDE